MDIDLTARYLDELTALGVTPPTKSTAAAAVFEEALRTAALTPASDLNDAVLAGTVTPENVAPMVRAAALELAAQKHALEVVNNLRTTFNKAIRAGLREDADRLIAELAAVFAKAAEKVHKAAEHFGPGTTAEDVITAKPEVVKMWREVDAHSSTLELVSKAYRSLLADIMRTPDRRAVSLLPEQVASLFVTGDVDINQAEETYRQPNRWLALAHAGYTLRLNTPTEAEKVRAAHDKRVADALEAERQVGLAAHRRRYMPIGV